MARMIMNGKVNVNGTMMNCMGIEANSFGEALDLAMANLKKNNKVRHSYKLIDSSDSDFEEYYDSYEEACERIDELYDDYVDFCWEVGIEEARYDDFIEDFDIIDINEM